MRYWPSTRSQLKALPTFLACTVCIDLHDLFDWRRQTANKINRIALLRLRRDNTRNRGIRTAKCELLCVVKCSNVTPQLWQQQQQQQQQRTAGFTVKSATTRQYLTYSRNIRYAVRCTKPVPQKLLRPSFSMQTPPRLFLDASSEVNYGGWWSTVRFFGCAHTLLTILSLERTQYSIGHEWKWAERKVCRYPLCKCA